jgi:selT/selW/selH-like putative selenoprotein
VRVEFDKTGVDVFIQLADVLEEAFPTVMVTESEVGDARDGAFEVTHEDGTTLFSKLATGRAPRLEEVLEALERKLKADGKDPTASPGNGRACT